jgi:methionyl-tRNA formyltransferase
LPKYRGRHPIDWAMENNEKEIGITVHYVEDETIDTGDIIIQNSIFYYGQGYDLVMKAMCIKVGRLLETAIKQIENNCVYRRGQNEKLATYYPKRTKPRVF